MRGTTDSRPLHNQVAADFRAGIMSGDLPPGTPLPSTQEIATAFGVAGTTVQSALRLLKAEGYLDSRAGKAVWVRDRSQFPIKVGTYFTPGPQGWSYKVLKVEEVTPPRDVAAAFESGDRVLLRSRLCLLADVPVEICRSYYPMTVAAGTELAGMRKIKGGTPRVLTELGFPEVWFSDTVSTRLPTTEELEMLGLPAEVPVLRQFRVTRSTGDRVVEVAVLVKAGHLYEIHYPRVEAVNE